MLWLCLPQRLKSAVIQVISQRVSNADRAEFRNRGRIAPMSDKTRILKVEKDSDDGLLVTFSDGTRAGYVVEELLALRPGRERLEEPPESGWPTTGERGSSLGAPSSTKISNIAKSNTGHPQGHK